MHATRGHSCFLSNLLSTHARVQIHAIWSVARSFGGSGSLQAKHSVHARYRRKVLASLVLAFSYRSDLCPCNTAGSQPFYVVQRGHLYTTSTVCLSHYSSVDCLCCHGVAIKCLCYVKPVSWIASINDFRVHVGGNSAVARLPILHVWYTRAFRYMLGSNIICKAPRSHIEMLYSLALCLHGACSLLYACCTQ